MYADIVVERGRIRSVQPAEHGTTIHTDNGVFTFPGGHVLPGFVDSHAHLFGLGLRLTTTSLHTATSAADCVQRMTQGPLQGGWARAMGWNQELWDVAAFPTKDTLDAVFPHTPAVARRVDGHALWVNSAALRAAGINDTTPDPVGGTILRDGDGHATGILIDHAMDLVERCLPAFTDEAMTDLYRIAADHCASKGITEVHDMDVAPAWLGPLRALAERGALATRVQAYVGGQHDEWINAGLLPAGGEFLRLHGVKLYADGALGSRGAYLLAPYHDEPSTSGLELLTKHRIVQAGRAVIDAGWWALAVHAIGDAAVRTVLDAFAQIRTLPGGAELTLRLEHAQHVHPDDVHRFAELRVHAMVQPTHCTSDAPMAEQRLGPERLPWAYRWRSLLDANAMLAGSSDFPIEPADPMAGIDAFCRRIPNGTTQSWQPQERLTRDEAIKAFTSWGHRVTEVDHRRGRIAEGFDADLVVVDHDMTTCADDDIRATAILATFTAGTLRYQRPDQHETRPTA
ncbi:MAG: amidohydrolase [Candidatus Kapabacteria bacterium]|nr:amidohydrolase [Candidatus Kapabacteria bacterium]